jgi:hypothetical protein
MVPFANSSILKALSTGTRAQGSRKSKEIGTMQQQQRMLKLIEASNTTKINKVTQEYIVSDTTKIKKVNFRISLTVRVIMYIHHKTEFKIYTWLI